MLNVVSTIEEIKSIIKAEKQNGKSVGFVPTMGYLHEGHISLIKEARKQNGFTAVSIFVNPIQFNNAEDFETYPRDMERDRLIAEQAGADLIFHPSYEEMYPEDYKTFVEVKDLSQKLCGISRKGHFTGVTTIVSKFFNIVQPCRAYFGLKDAQQAAIIRKMVKDLNMDIEIITCPIVREKDGLAMSSRNVRLNNEDRKAALVLYKSLSLAQEEIKKGKTDAAEIMDIIRQTVSAEPKARLEYVQIVDPETLENKIQIKSPSLIALAAQVGKVRLIDNVLI